MGFAASYFSRQPGWPAPLTAATSRDVRFEEIDLLGIVWHGRYSSYLEDGRVAFGKRYGLSYQRFRDERIAAPIVQMHLDYLSPLRFGETVCIEATLCWCEALRLNFEYRLSRGEREVARGYTVQLLTDLTGNLLLVAPEWVQSFRQRWQEGLMQ